MPVALCSCSINLRPGIYFPSLFFFLTRSVFLVWGWTRNNVSSAQLNLSVSAFLARYVSSYAWNHLKRLAWCPFAHPSEAFNFFCFISTLLVSNFPLPKLCHCRVTFGAVGTWCCIAANHVRLDVWLPIFVLFCFSPVMNCCFKSVQQQLVCPVCFV